MGVPPTKYMLFRVLEGNVERDALGVPPPPAPAPALAMVRVGKGAEGEGVDEDLGEKVPLCLLGVEDTL